MSSNTLYQVGEKWYFTTTTWKGTIGPFDTLLEASQAMTHELESEHGKKEERWSVEEIGGENAG